MYIFSRQVFFYCNPMDRPVWVETHCCVLFISAYGVPFEIDFGSTRAGGKALLAGPLVRRKVLAKDAGLVGFYIMPESPLFAYLAQFTRIYKRRYGNPPSYIRQQKNIKVFVTPELTSPP